MKESEVENAIVTFDTSALQAKDGAWIISYDAKQFLKNYPKKCALEFVIPSVVVRELFGHYSKEVLETYNKIGSSVKRINKILDLQYRHPVRLKTFGRAVAGIFNKALADLEIKRINTPIDAIDVRHLYDSALQRKPPFSKEKDEGIKDYFILQTFGAICRARKGKKVVIICADKDLREAIDRDLVEKEEVELYPNIAAYQSYLDLRLQNISAEWIRETSIRAKKKFYDEDSQSGLFFTEDVWGQILKDYSERFSGDYITPSDHGLHYRGLAMTESPWERVVVDPVPQPQEDKRSDWYSVILLNRKYQFLDAGAVSVIDSRELDMLLIFRVRWSAKVATDYRFFTPKIDGIDFISRTLSDPTVPQLTLDDLMKPGKGETAMAELQKIRRQITGKS